MCDSVPKSGTKRPLPKALPRTTDVTPKPTQAKKTPRAGIPSSGDDVLDRLIESEVIREAPPAKKRKHTHAHKEDETRKTKLIPIPKKYPTTPIKADKGTIKRHINIKKSMSILKKECVMECKKLAELANGRVGIIEQHTQLTPLKEMLCRYYSPMSVSTDPPSDEPGVHESSCTSPSMVSDTTEPEWKLILLSLNKICKLMGTMEKRNTETEDNYISMVLQTFNKMEIGRIPRTMYAKDCNNKQVLKLILENLLIDVEVPVDVKLPSTSSNSERKYHYCPHCREPFSIVPGDKGAPDRISKDSLLSEEDQTILDTITLDINSPIDVTDKVVGSLTRIDTHPRPIPSNTPGVDVAHMHYMLQHLYEKPTSSTPQSSSVLYPPHCLHKSPNTIGDSATVLYGRCPQI